jgi:hypothetical protein
MQSYENWANDSNPNINPSLNLNANINTSPNANFNANLDSNYYPNKNKQQSFFTTPDSDRSRMTWPRNDSYQSPGDSIRHDARIQDFNDAQREDAGAPPGVTLVPRSSNNAPPTHTTGTGRGRMVDT